VIGRPAEDRAYRARDGRRDVFVVRPTIVPMATSNRFG
jgi:hypothetical protein